MKYVFLYLALLNIVDGILTYIGLTMNIIDEANPVMKSLFIMKPMYFIVFKFTLSILLSLIVYLSLDIVNNKGVFLLTTFAALLYSFVMLLHGAWILDYFS
ncbi:MULTISPECIES: DUF5658 family protein [Bacillaceae]|uniref:DUF5658 family protein n=1 Tax=Bacillaceae TaxID=186817 RepID=UPI000BFDFD6F|nr:MULTISPECIES: DUF5658 family protein [Bacillaceae]PGT87606.1 hypothetical protein COD11_06705 [Bacillus sp. AFS040349]UGB29471.1 DUF5658 family protein [Metabacillus sp. B2-18]